MKWSGVVQKTAEHQKLEPYREDVRAVTVYSHTFYVEKDGKANERDSLYYTAVAKTPEDAERQAYAVYLRAVKCRHRLRRISPVMMACSCCGLQKRLTVAEERQQKEEAEHQRAVERHREKARLAAEKAANGGKGFLGRIFSQ